MNAWQLDEMKASLDAAEWHRLNEPDPCEKQMKTASVSLIEAVRLLRSAEVRVADAMTEVFDTPMEYRLGAFLDSLEEIDCELNRLAEKYGRGERE